MAEPELLPDAPGVPAVEAKAADAPPAALDTEPGTPKVEIFEGRDEPVARGARPAGPQPQGDVTLDFAEADVKDVVRTVLGDILKVPYTIDSGIQGKVTLKTNRPLRREDVVAALETALRVNGAAIVQASGVYNVVPAAEAVRRIDGLSLSGEARARQPGFGVEIVPLRYIAAEEMQKILQPVAPAGGVLAADGARNIVFLAGTGPERAAMLDTIRLFDVDYMRGMSYALVHPDHVDAAGMADELSRIFQHTKGSGASLLRFVPLARLNTLLVVAPRAGLLKDVQRWVDRLDVPPRGPGRRVYFYRLQNARAQDVARSLAAVYGGTLGGIEQDDTVNGAADAPAEGAAAAPAPAGRVRPSRTGMPAGLFVAVDEPNNALIIRTEGPEYTAIERFLKEVDVLPDQVMIELTIVEVTLNDALKFGVEWFFQNDDHKFTQAKTSTPTAQFPGFNFSYTVPDVKVAVNALGTVSDVSVIASPKLMTLNNRPAVFQVGDQVPVIVQSATGIQNATDLTTVNTVQFRDTGIVLKVTPRIGRSGVVFVDIDQEVSDAVQTSTSGIDSPTIQQRKVSTTVAVQDGDSIALGGLIRRNRTYDDSGVPYLKDVPVFGKLFGTTSVTGDRTELLIFVHPRIVRNPAAAREVTEQLRRGLRGLEALGVDDGAGEAVRRRRTAP